MNYIYDELLFIKWITASIESRVEENVNLGYKIISKLVRRKWKSQKKWKRNGIEKDVFWYINKGSLNRIIWINYEL